MCVRLLILYLSIKNLEDIDLQIPLLKQHSISLMGYVTAIIMISLHGESHELG
jgi:hypothetical protein